MFELESSDNREELLRFKMMKMWSATLGRPSEEERERKKRLKELHMSQDPYRGASTNNTLKSIKRRKEKQKKAKSPNGDEGTNTSLPRNGILNNNNLYPEVKMRQHSKSMGHGLNLIKNANYLPNRRYTVAMDGDEEFPEMMMMREQKLRFMDEGLDWDRSDSGTPRSSGSRSGVSGGRRWKKGLSVSMVNVDRLGKGGPNLGDHPSTPNYWGSGVWNDPNTMEERVDNRPPVLNRRSLVINAMNDFNKQSDSCGPTTNGEMVSRRKILSRSRDDLNLDVPAEHPDEEDVWYQKEKLFKDHIQEVLNKWESIDDEIWAKIIVLERNRRVAKAYARAPVLTVNGSDDGFDGFRIGLSGFENPMRDPKTDEVKRHIGQGCKIKMDDSGNILIKRIAKSNVYIKSTLNTPEDTAIANDILKLPNGGLEAEKPVKLFDMKKFQQNVSRELKRGYPDRRKLESQCISAVAFVKNEADILEAPCWIMLINVVAMDMLKSKMPPVKNPRPAIDIRNRPRIPIPDEDPYSIAGSGSSGSSGNGNRERSRDKPPKLPPRDNNAIYGTTGMPRPDYEHMVDEHRFRQQLEARNKAPKKGEKRSDDPYYCGLRARIPNFAKTKAQRDKEAANSIYARLPTHAQPQAHPGYGHIGMYGPARGFLDNVPPPSNNMNNGYSFRNRPFERNPTTWVPKAPMRNAVSEWESYWQKEN